MKEILKLLRDKKIFSQTDVASLLENGSSIDMSEMEYFTVGSSVILRPKHRTWDGFEQIINQFTEDFMQGGRKQPKHQKRESL